MNNIFNFVNLQMCEYASIFPTVASLLDHLLFTNGNGYNFNTQFGMPMVNSGVLISEYDVMTTKEFDELIAACHAKEREWAEQYLELQKRHSPDAVFDEAYLAECCKKYKRVSVTDADFTKEALLSDLQRMAAERRGDCPYDEYYLRPYPLSKGYADIFNISEKTPKWFVQIAFNFCSAWVTYLTEELAIDNVWKPMSEHAPIEPTSENIVLAEGIEDLVDMIRSDDDYDGWIDKQPEKTSDYGDKNWTTKHRDMLAGEVTRLGALLNVE